MLPLPHMAFALQTGQNHGYAYLPRFRSHSLRFCKTLMPSFAQATKFCPLSPGSCFAVEEFKKNPKSNIRNPKWRRLPQYRYPAR